MKTNIEDSDLYKLFQAATGQGDPRENERIRGELARRQELMDREHPERVEARRRAEAEAGPSRHQRRDIIKMPPAVDGGMLQQADRANDSVRAAKAELGLKLWTGAEDERRSQPDDGKGPPGRR